MFLEKKRSKKKTSTGYTSLGKRDKILKKKELTRSILGVKKKTLRIGDVCNLKITALAPNNIGIDEYSFSYAVFVPNAKIGSQIKAKVLKVQESSYAVAQILEEKKELELELINKESINKESINKESINKLIVPRKVDSTSTDFLNNIPVKPGDLLTVSIKKKMEKGNAGLVELANNYRLIIPLSNFQKISSSKELKGDDLENVKVTVTRVKRKYGFAKIEKLGKKSTVANLDSKEHKILSKALSKVSNKKENGFNQKDDPYHHQITKRNIEVGCKFTTTFPLTSLKKFASFGQASILRKQKLTTLSISKETNQNNTHQVDKQRIDKQRLVKQSKFLILNVKGSILFLKIKKGRLFSEKLTTLEQNGDKNLRLRVRVKITAKSTNCSVGKILQIHSIKTLGLKPSTLLDSTKDRALAPFISFLPSGELAGSYPPESALSLLPSAITKSEEVEERGEGSEREIAGGDRGATLRFSSSRSASKISKSDVSLRSGTIFRSETREDSAFQSTGPRPAAEVRRAIEGPKGGRASASLTSRSDVTPLGSTDSRAPSQTDDRDRPLGSRSLLPRESEAKTPTVEGLDPQGAFPFQKGMGRGEFSLNSNSSSRWFRDQSAVRSSASFTTPLTDREYEKKKKRALVLNSIREMINHGMHFGEKAVKCHARMKNYLWTLRSRSNSNINPLSNVINLEAMNNHFRSSLLTSLTSRSDVKTETSRSDVKRNEDDDHENGLKISPNRNRFGIDEQSVNQKIKKASNQTQHAQEKPGLPTPFIKKGRHVINLLKTRRCLNQALNKVTKYALKGRTFLFIGTKKPAAGLVARASFFTKNSFYVNTRWLGGMLTNWKTICKSISKIRPILKEKQKVVRDILEKRQAIKTRLIKKAFLLKKKSKLILNKGRLLLETLKKEKTIRLKHTQKLTALRNEFLYKGIQYSEKRQKLIEKRRELIYQTFLLKEKGLELALKHKAILNQLAIYSKKLREYKYLLILTSEIEKIKVTTVNSSQSLLSVSYGKLKALNKLESEAGVKQKNWILPNPPKEILNRIVLTYLQQNHDEKKPLFDQKELFTSNSLIIGKSTNPIDTVVLLEKESHKKQFFVCSTLLSKFSGFSSFIKSVIKSLITSLQKLEAQANIYSRQLNKIQNLLKTYFNLKQKYIAELQFLKVKFTKERSVIRIIKRKIKVLEAQKKLLKFLPRLRYLPTPQTKISEIVQILLARIVDPKLKYPIEKIYDQKLSSSSKKLAAARKKKWQRLEKYFGGIANMTNLTKTQISRNVAIIIGQKEEMNAVYECQKLGIKMFTIVDSNCNPTLSDHIIPANDDSRSSIKYILTKIITRLRLAQKLRTRLSIFLNKTKK